jgi:anaerobic magnesium-protoporphyrin IX monomethyl ester cyclase
MKIILINPPSDSVDDDRVEPPLGLLYIAATLIESGHINVKIIDLTGTKSEMEVNARLNSIPEADIVGVTSFCTNYSFAKRIVEIVKKTTPSTYTLFGGPHASALPEFILDDTDCDAVIVGEGEDAFLDCVNSFQKGEKKLGIIKVDGRRNIDTYAFPARHLIDINTYSRTLLGKSAISLISSRGCQHHCFFCNSVIMGGGNSTPRYRSSENVFDEMKMLRDSYSHYRFNDDHFTGNPRLEDLLLKLRDLDVVFRVFARIEDLNEKSCKLLKDAGCVHITIGLESLNPDNLRIIGKVKQIGKEKNIKFAKENGITIRASLMVGLPYDTDRNIEFYFSRIADAGIDEFAIYPLIPYPGTLLWKFPERFGYKIVNKDFMQYTQMGKDRKTCYALRNNNFGPKDVKRWLKIASDTMQDSGIIHQSQSKVAH